MRECRHVVGHVGLMNHHAGGADPILLLACACEHPLNATARARKRLACSAIAEIESDLIGDPVTPYPEHRRCAAEQQGQSRRDREQVPPHG